MISASFRSAKPKFELSQKRGALLHRGSPFTNDPLLEKVGGRLAGSLSMSSNLLYTHSRQSWCYSCFIDQKASSMDFLLWGLKEFLFLIYSLIRKGIWPVFFNLYKSTQSISLGWNVMDVSVIFGPERERERCQRPPAHVCFLHSASSHHHFFFLTHQLRCLSTASLSKPLFLKGEIWVKINGRKYRKTLWLFGVWGIFPFPSRGKAIFLHIQRIYRNKTFPWQINHFPSILSYK